jgi:hypothetical protein
MSFYDFLKFLHVAFVMAWVGTAASMLPLALRSRKSSLERKRNFTEGWNWLGERWFPIFSGLTGLAGIALWIKGSYDFGTLWIDLALTGWLISMAVGGGFFGRTIPRLTKAYADGDEAAGDTLIDRVLLVARIDLMILTLVVLDMVVKPT